MPSMLILRSCFQLGTHTLCLQSDMNSSILPAILHILPDSAESRGLPISHPHFLLHPHSSASPLISKTFAVCWSSSLPFLSPHSDCKPIKNGDPVSCLSGWNCDFGLLFCKQTAYRYRPIYVIREYTYGIYGSSQLPSISSDVLYLSFLQSFPIGQQLGFCLLTKLQTLDCEPSS